MIKIDDVVCVYDKTPRFSWKLSGDSGQKNCQIRLYDEDNICVWDSGICESVNRHDIFCTAELEPETAYHWEVSCEGTDGSKDRAEGNSFVTGISSWSAKWAEPGRTRKPITDLAQPITTVIEQDDPREKLDPAVYMRKSVYAGRTAGESRTLCDGARNLCIVGQRNACFRSSSAPGNTSYGKRLEYQVIDVREYLHSGENVSASFWQTVGIPEKSVRSASGSSTGRKCAFVPAQPYRNRWTPPDDRIRRSVEME